MFMIHDRLYDHTYRHSNLATVLLQITEISFLSYSTYSKLFPLKYIRNKLDRQNNYQGRDVQSSRLVCGEGGGTIFNNLRTERHT